jgi:hypothetical protein
VPLCAMTVSAICSRPRSVSSTKLDLVECHKSMRGVLIGRS